MFTQAFDTVAVNLRFSLLQKESLAAHHHRFPLLHTDQKLQNGPAQHGPGTSQTSPCPAPRLVPIAGPDLAGPELAFSRAQLAFSGAQLAFSRAQLAFSRAQLAFSRAQPQQCGLARAMAPTPTRDVAAPVVMTPAAKPARFYQTEGLRKPSSLLQATILGFLPRRCAPALAVLA